MLLARRGYKTLLLDKAEFPSEIPHGHFIHRHGPGLLKRWGLLDRVTRSNCPPVVNMTMDLGDFPLTGRNLIIDGVALGYGPRRKVLDSMLIDAAIEAGAEFRQGFIVEDYISNDDAIAGIRGRQNRGGSSIIEERSRITIGADGRNSPLARAVRAASYEATPSLACWYFGYWSGVPTDELGLYVRQTCGIFAFPTNDNLLAVFIGWPIAEFPQVRANIEASFMAAIDLVPELAARIRNGKHEERFYGTGDVANFFRKPYGPGWALVGDAGLHKDPYLALGICDAFRDSELLVDALDEGLSGKRPLLDALADYEQRRNEATMADYRLNIDLAQFKPLPPEVYQLRAAVRGNQEDTNKLLMARQGMIPEADFFNPENMERLLSNFRARASQAS